MQARPVYKNQSLRGEMIIKATKPPFREIFLSLHQYIQQNGNQVHPELGDLLLFANEVETLWSRTNPNKGENLIVGLIRNQFVPEQNEDEMVWGAEAESTFNPMG